MEPDIIAIHDQAQAEVRQKARVVAAYYKQLLAEGVETYEATRLALMFQRPVHLPRPAAAHAGRGHGRLSRDPMIGRQLRKEAALTPGG